LKIFKKAIGQRIILRKIYLLKGKSLEFEFGIKAIDISQTVWQNLL